ncbi:MAG TPA: HEAT repeat domain-containing protein [Granulicella sp.]|jgi:HEAT repeat protein|nr:HEAT repeat domain-containing protein [Granulicella sp.]
MNDLYASSSLPASRSSVSASFFRVALTSAQATVWIVALLLASARPSLALVPNPQDIAKPQDAPKPQQVAQLQQTTKPDSANTQEEVDAALPARNPEQPTVAENLDTAWSMLTSAVTDRKHPQSRIQALAAIGTLGASPRGEAMLTTAMHDPDLDVRIAAVLAAGQSKDRNLTTPLRAMLDDKEPQVAFTAATTLWKMNDHSGEDILTAVVDGERSANAGVVNGAMHTAHEDLRNPATLARIGALQGASMLLGPFGFGITAYEYIHKNGGNSARALAVEQIAQEKTAPIRNKLIGALDDKDPSVRAAAAKALGAYRDKAVASALANLFYDSKLPVRLTAAAAYLRSNGAAPGVPSNAPDRVHSTARPSAKPAPGQR